MEEFNRRFLGEAREAQYRKGADMKAFGVFWGVVLLGGWALGGAQALAAPTESSGACSGHWHFPRQLECALPETE